MFDRSHLGDEIGHVDQLLCRAAAGQYQLDVRVAGLDQAANIVEGGQAVLKAEDNLIQDDQIVVFLVGGGL